jgi:hypothetical protein
LCLCTGDRPLAGTTKERKLNRKNKQAYFKNTLTKLQEKFLEIEQLIYLFQAWLENSIASIMCCEKSKGSAWSQYITNPSNAKKYMFFCGK